MFGVQFAVCDLQHLPVLQKNLETQISNNKKQVVCLWPSVTNSGMWIFLVFIILTKLRICVFKCRMTKAKKLYVKWIPI